MAVRISSNYASEKRYEAQKPRHFTKNEIYNLLEEAGWFSERHNTEGALSVIARSMYFYGM
ncbi:MAG: hypothetical protein IJV29_12225, partial [Butyrivibrio sp.]|nr:hypothetical protein [Butyrivibrio sp.]